MEHKTVSEMRGIAEVLPHRLRFSPMSTRERLERWAEALERQRGRHLRTLFEIEYAPPGEREAVRADDSPLSVALEDARLRAEGLGGDTIGDALAFFGISETELHAILCYCHHGETMAADVAAMRVRVAASRAGGGRSSGVASMYGGGGLFAALIAVGALAI